MHRVIAACLLSVILFSTCLNAPRDNVYDPKNPDKAYMSATIYEFGLHPMEGASIFLVDDGEIVKADTSDILGNVEFIDIVPGIYGLNGEVTYYSPVAYFPESIWAGEYIGNRSIEFVTLNFDDDVLGTSSPHRFEPIHGTWEINQDIQQPGAHSIPQVYTGSDSDSGEFAVALCEAEAHKFLVQAKLKVSELSGPDWQVGVIFRYQDENNYYAFLVSPETTFCSLVLNGQHTYTRIKARESAAGVWQDLQIERPEIDRTLRLSIDDVMIFWLTDNILTGGKVGLLVSDNNQPFPVYVNFDDVTLDLSTP